MTEMTDAEFLSYCFTHAETPRAGFVPKQIARLLTLADPDKYKENIEYFNNREHSIISCDEAEIKMLVQLSLERIKKENTPKTERPRIITAYLDPILPWRDNDWCAWFDGEEENETSPRGWGKTEQEAIDELISIFEEEN